MLEYVEHDIIRKRPVKLRMHRKEPPPLDSSLVDRQGRRPAVHRRRIIDPFRLGEGLVQVARPPPGPCMAPRMDCHRSTHPRRKIPGQIQELKWLRRLKNHQPWRLKY